MRFRARFVVLFLCMTTALLNGKTRETDSSTADSKSPFHTIAVLPFRNSSNNDSLDHICQSIPDLVPACATKTDKVAFIDRQQLNKVLKEQKISITASNDPAASIKAGKLLGAKYVILGGIVSRKSTITINAHIYEVETARTAGSAKIEGKNSDLINLVQSLSTKLIKSLDIELPAMTSTDIDRSPEANLHFIRGLGYYHGNMHQHAITEFMKTLSIDSTHSRARYWNAKTYFTLDDFEHAEIELVQFLLDFPKDENADEVKKMLSSIVIKKGQQ